MKHAKFVLGVVALTLVFGVSLRLSGCVGEDFPERDEFTGEGSDVCQYQDCEKPATGDVTVKVAAGTNHGSRETTVFYDERDYALCDEHARCSSFETWPESAPVKTWIHSFLGGLVLGGILAALISDRIDRKRKKALEEAQPPDLPAP